MVTPVRLPDALLKRLGVTVGRSLRRRCPYCGEGGIFRNYFRLKDRCPSCNTLFAYEDGYFLGAYVVNLIVTIILATVVLILLLQFADLTLLQLQIGVVGAAVLFSLAFVPFAQLLWMALDLTINPPGDFSKRPRT